MDGPDGDAEIFEGVVDKVEKANGTDKGKLQMDVGGQAGLVDLNAEPRYALAVVVEHGGSGAQTAAPIARDIMAKALELDPVRMRPTVSLERRRDPRGDPA